MKRAMRSGWRWALRVRMDVLELAGFAGIGAGLFLYWEPLAGVLAWSLAAIYVANGGFARK